MSFGYSIGDVIAIAGVIERIVVEVKSYHSAPLHFQRLAIELDFLSSVCKQVFELRPSLPDELAQIERMRALAIQCLGPLQEFEAKMSKYENSLGSRAPLGNTWGKKRKRERLRNFGKRVHWSVIERHEVDELREILTSEILAINTLLTIQEWKSLKTQNIVNQGYATQLRTLIKTTSEASSEIKQFLVNAKAASEHLEQLIVSGNLTQKEQIRILTTIENKSKETHKTIRDLSQWHRSYTSGVQGAIDDMSSQVVKLFSFKSYMEEWIKKIVHHCKDIIAMIERNTQILLSLHSMMSKLSVLLLRPGIDLPTLEFENPFGIKMALPYQLCDTWEGLNRLLLCMFFNKPGLKLVEAGRFLVTHSRTNKAIKPALWTNSVAPGDQVSMSMVLERLGGRSRKSCPRCRHPLPTISPANAQGIVCVGCGLWSSVAETTYVNVGVSQSSGQLGIPTPPPEQLRLQSSSWNGSWTSDYVKEQALLRNRRSPKKLPRRFSYDSGFDDPVDLLSDDEVESTFRRVHVMPYQGDPLEALIKAGQRCRELMIEFSSAWDPESPDFDISRFKSTFGDIISEFDELQATGISPLFELRMRKDSAARRRVLETWIQKTAGILENSPLAESQQHIKSITGWLLSNRGDGSGGVTRHWPLDYEMHVLRHTEYWKDASEIADHYHSLLSSYRSGPVSRHDRSPYLNWWAPHGHRRWDLERAGVDKKYETHISDLANT